MDLCIVDAGISRSWHFGDQGGFKVDIRSKKSPPRPLATTSGKIADFRAWILKKHLTSWTSYESIRPATVPRVVLPCREVVQHSHLN